MTETKKKSVFEVMSAVDVSPYLFEKNKQSYLPWSRAIELLKLRYPDAKSTECTFPTDKYVSTLKAEAEGAKHYATTITRVDMPYFTDGRTCYVRTRLEIPSEGIDEYCTLPVMDFKNQCITADKITMSDVNKALRRCATKNIAMATGLGLGLWHKEEVSEAAAAENTKNAERANTAIETFKAKITEGYDRDKLASWLKINYGTGNPQTIKDADKLNQLKADLDNLKAEDFKASKKKESK
jgi:hypothetical protein